MPANPFPFQGLSDLQVIAARVKHGRNTIEEKTDGTFWPALKSTVLEPMFLLLLATSIIYFALGERTEAYFMAGAIVLVSTISIYQDARSRKAHVYDYHVASWYRAAHTFRYTEKLQ